MKLHVGSGSIYLIGWVNVDLPSPESGCALVKDVQKSKTDLPSGIKKWGTTEDQYYARIPTATLEKFEKGISSRNHYTDLVCDAYGTFWELPCDDGNADEILSRQVFEHMSVREATAALKECRRVLCDGGILRLDVPDHPESLKQYAATGRDFFKRHICGSHRNAANWHICGWDRKSLTAFLDDLGFDFIEEEENIHIYPAFCLRFRKRRDDVLDKTVDQITPWFAAWEYCGNEPGSPLRVNDNWNRLEVGCGQAPWPDADMYCDINPDTKAALPFDKQDKFVEADICDLPSGPKGWTGLFDYVFASHVLEHVEDPRVAVHELNRVASRGCVICPSAFKEGLFAFHENDHKWCALPSVVPGLLTLWKYPAGFQQAALGEHGVDASKSMHRILRLEHQQFGSAGHCMKQWFHEAEPRLDVIVKWTGNLQLKLIE